MQAANKQLDFQPVIIIGAARSGTNMLRDVLSGFDGAGTWPCDEINAVWRYSRASSESDELTPADVADVARAYIRDSFRQIAERTKARWVVEKTCANSLRVDYVREILPESKFIFLVRDGRAVVASAMKRWRAGFDLRYTLRKAFYVPPKKVPAYAVRFVRNRLFRSTSKERRLAHWGPRFAGIDELLATRSLAEVCAVQWQKSVLKAATSLAALPTRDVFQVRYESLVENATDDIQQIIRFLSIPVDESQLASIAARVTDSSINKWQRDLSWTEIDQIEPIVDDTWRQLEQIMPVLVGSTAEMAASC